MTKYAFSMNGDYYNNCDGKDIKEVVKNLIKDRELKEDFDLLGHSVIQIGETVGYADNGEDCYENIIDYFQQDGYEFGGDYAESYLDTISKEAEEYLKKELNRIWKKFKKINKEKVSFFQVENIKVYKIEMDGSFEEITKGI